MKIIKLTAILTISMFAGATFANKSDSLIKCEWQSHNPKCWEQPSEPTIDFCPVAQSCTKINKIVALGDESYFCEGGEKFDCTKIVNKYGQQALGKFVMVTFSQIDACHMPGACGVSACQPLEQIGTAEESLLCQP